nr:hypothetical protein [cf. Phormidesmis sp. LEGE 11477]
MSLIPQMLRISCCASRNPRNAIARAIAYAIEQPSDIDINEIIVRPTKQEL